jgi:hypothetical protein
MSAEGLLKRYRILESELANAKQKLAAKEAEMHRLRCDMAGVHQGDIIQFADGKKGRVTNVTTTWMRPNSDGRLGTPPVAYNPEKKSGGWADQIRNAYGSWVVISRAPPATQGEAP